MGTYPASGTLMDQRLITSALGVGSDWVEVRWLAERSNHLNTFLLTLQNAAATRGIRWVMGSSGTVSYSRVGGGSQFIQSNFAVNFTVPVNTKFWVALRADFIAGRIKAKAWLDGSPEPELMSWIDIALGTVTAADLTHYWVRMGGNTGDSAQVGHIEVIVPTGELDCSGAFVSGSGGGDPGYTCASPADTGDHRHFQLDAVFVPSSSQVFVEGLRQTRGTDYTESPTTGQIIFAMPLTITEADSVYVCYTAMGAL